MGKIEKIGKLIAAGLKKAKPLVVEGVETAKDLMADFKSENKYLKQSHRQLRKTMEEERALTNARIDPIKRTIERLDSEVPDNLTRIRTKEALSRDIHSARYIFDTGMSDARTHIVLNAPMGIKTKNTRIRNLLAREMKEERKIRNYVRPIRRAERQATRTERRLRNREEVHEQLNTLFDEPREPYRGYGPNNEGMRPLEELFPERDENATEAGFEAYMLKKYGRKPTRID